MPVEPPLVLVLPPLLLPPELLVLPPVLLPPVLLLLPPVLAAVPPPVLLPPLLVLPPELLEGPPPEGLAAPLPPVEPGCVGCSELPQAAMKNASQMPVIDARTVFIAPVSVFGSAAAASKNQSGRAEAAPAVVGHKARSLSLVSL